MDIKPVRRKSVYEDIVLQIQGMIDRGELAVGDRLPPERRLAEMFSVSRNTVREAIRALSEQGQLESRQGSGTYVSEPSEDSGDFAASFAGAILRGQPALKEIFEVRKLMEPEIAGLAARNASPGDITRLEAILAEQEQAVAKGETGGTHDQQLHAALADASGNSVMRALVKALHDELYVSRVAGLQSQARQHASLKAHRAIVQAVKQGHIIQAEKAMREHLDEVESIVFTNT